MTVKERETRETRELRETVRDEMGMHRQVLAALAAGPRTIPEIAQAVGRPADEVVIWVMGMRRYGWLKEIKGSDGDGYFQYQAEERA
jgi:predicted Rossmann fold nucleotide-binding protein DprA/Smf involved in DNA uptake